MGLFLDRVVEDQYAFIPLDRTQHRFDLLPQRFRRIGLFGEKPGDLIMADLAIQQRRKTRRRRRTERTQQIVAIKL